MKKILLLLLTVACISAHAQVYLSHPDANHIQISNYTGTKLFVANTIFASIDTTNAPGQVAIYQAGTATAAYGGFLSTAYYINGVQATSARQVANQIAAWQAASGGGGGGSANPYPSSDYSTSTLQTTGNSYLQALNLKLPNQGQQAMAGSLPVTIANNQSSIPVVGNFYQTTQPVSMTKPLNLRSSNAVTVGTTSTTLTSANASGYRAFIQVPKSATASVFISIGGTATLTPPSIEIQPGGSYTTSSEYPDTQAITAISTVSQAITVITY